MLRTILTGLLLSTGCGKKASSVPSPVDKQVFANAPLEVKQAWEQAVEANRTNGYVLARRLLHDLSKAPLAPEQSAAVDSEMVALTKRIYDRANKGDPAARAAIRELRGR